MTTVVRLPEIVPQKSFTVNLNSNYEDELNRQLSSPLSSYHVVTPDGTGNRVLLTHTQYYPERLESTKQKLNGLRSEMDALRQEIEQKRKEDQHTFQQKIEEANRKHQKLEQTMNRKHQKLEQTMNRKISDLEAERQANKNLLLDWETKSRLAQALNDLHVFENHIIPQDVYASLKVEGCNYLPYLLSVCAIYYKEEVVTCLKIGRKEQDKYEAKAAILSKKGLMDSVDQIWYALPNLDRNIMIKLWLTRPNIRTSMAHPIPTVEEGINIIHADSQLSVAERCFIDNFLPKAVDKGREPLFTFNTF